jgi:hypothetical protein
MNDAVLRPALAACLDALLRMIPDAQAQHGLESISDDEHDAVIATAATALYGVERSAWPAVARAAAEGDFD